jgi:UrcA family protein
MSKALPMIASLVVAAALVLPTVSQATESDSVRVSYADLNLGSDAGAHALRGRIAYAARIVCDREDSRAVALAVPTGRCRSKAVDGAEPAFEAAVAAARHGTVTVLESAAIVVSAD